MTGPSPGPGAPAARPVPPAGMRPQDIGGLRQVEDPQVSPDGAQVAFVVADVDLAENRERRRVFVGDAAGGRPARPFTAGPDDRLARWSPDGATLAFVSGAGEEPSELCTIPVGAGGERVVLCRLAEPPSEVAWSPDGTRVAFVARDPDPARYGPVGEPRADKDMPARRITHLYSRLDGAGFVADRPKRVMVAAADGSGAPRCLTDGEFQSSGVAWSPDGARLAFVSARHEGWDLDGAVDVYTVAADGSSPPVGLTRTGAAHAAPAFSPDGARLAALVDPSPMDGPRHARVVVLDVASGARRDLTGDLDRNCDPLGAARPPVWDGDRVLCVVEDAGDVHLYAFPATGEGAPEPVVAGRRWVTGFHAAGGTLAFAATTPTRVAELFVRPLGGGPGTGERRLTDVGGPLRARVRFAEPEAYAARSADGTEVPCWAIPPVGAEPGRRSPTLLNVHGGPFASYGNRFFDEFQVQAGAGFGVLYCNPRGSSGYSEAWGRAVRWPGCARDPGSGWGGVDYEDVMACVREGARRFDWVDADRLGVLGGSYGGYMTSWIIGHTDLFEAACSERACNDLLALESTSDVATAFRAYVGATHLEDPGAYLSRSPITFAAHMTTPLLILHSDDDLRCPVGQAEALFAALRLLGREPLLVRFPGEHHELSRSGAPRHRVERMALIVEWFADHLGAAEPPPRAP